MSDAGKSHTPRTSHPDNLLVAEKLDEVADLLEQQQANPFRTRAFREAAASVSDLDTPIGDNVAEGGAKALEALPKIGPSIAATIVEILQTGHLRMLDTLRGDLDPERLFQTVPQIGPHLAGVIHDALGISTLEALEIAAHDGRLAALPGFGRRRVRGIQYALAELLARRRPTGSILNTRAGGDADAEPAAPPISETLDVDREYRARAQAGSLPVIAPQRFNPNNEAWLPILHTERGDWHFTALYSNTARAHRLQRTRDWVVIRYERDHEGAAQCTVVTEHRGALTGKRVIRGHEAACARYYASH
jgi:hypothetical protein